MLTKLEQFLSDSGRFPLSRIAACLRTCAPRLRERALLMHDQEGRALNTGRIFFEDGKKSEA